MEISKMLQRGIALATIVYIVFLSVKYLLQAAPLEAAESLTIVLCGILLTQFLRMVDEQNNQEEPTLPRQD